MRAIWVSAIKVHNDGSYDGGIRLAAGQSRREMLEDLWRWCDHAGDEDEEGEPLVIEDEDAWVKTLSDQQIENYLGEYDEIDGWTIEELHV